MSDLDPRLRQRLGAYRNDVINHVAGPGPDQARQLLRRRRRMAAVAVAAAAVVLVVAPVVANAALNNDDPTPPVLAESATPTPGSPPASPTPPPTGSPTPSTAPTAPDGRISRAQLLAARVDLPNWQPGEMEGGCATAKVRLRTDTNETYVSELAENAFEYGDLDGDGATETVAVVSCRYGEASAKQVVAFDRDRDGRIVTLGRVVRTGEKLADILATQVDRSGSVEVRVADIQPCCGTPGYLQREQVRTYRWDGERFDQTDGPTAFGKDSRLTDLRMSMTHELADVPGTDTGRTLTTVFTVTNAGPVDAPQVAFHGIEVGERAGGDWSRCDPHPSLEADNPTCLLPGVPVGESRRYTFVHLVPDKPGPDARTQRFSVFRCDAQDRWWPDLKDDDNTVTAPIRF